MNRSSNAFDDERNVEKINELKEQGDFDGLMDFFFELLDKNPEDIETAKHSDLPSRLKSMRHAIAHFTEKEEYEKCARITELVKRLEQ